MRIEPLQILGEVAKYLLIVLIVYLLWEARRIQLRWPKSTKSS